jgi:hypothetical protein
LLINPHPSPGAIRQRRAKAPAMSRAEAHLGLALIEALDDQALYRLAERLAPLLNTRLDEGRLPVSDGC